MIKEGKTNRRPYRKPQLEQVDLVSEEAVLAACKLKTSGASIRCKNKSTGCNRGGGKS
jgi:hypothetical protein